MITGDKMRAWSTRHPLLTIKLIAALLIVATGLTVYGLYHLLQFLR